MNIVYGFVKDNVFLSGRMKRNILPFFPDGKIDGVYQIDMDNDDFMETLDFADIEESKKYFSKNSQFNLVNGISFNNKFIPSNLFKYSNILLNIYGTELEDFQEILAVEYNNLFFYFDVLTTPKEYALVEIKELCEKMEQEESINIEHNIKGITPEINLAFFLKKNLVISQIAKKREEEYKTRPEYFLKKVFEECGATVTYIEKRSNSFEVKWNYAGNSISSLVGLNFNILEAGFCVSGYDKTQSAHSIVPLMKNYIEHNDHIHKTRY